MEMSFDTHQRLDSRPASDGPYSISKQICSSSEKCLKLTAVGLMLPGGRVNVAWEDGWGGHGLGRRNNTKGQQGDESDKGNGKSGEHVLLQLLMLSRLLYASSLIINH